MQSFWKLDLSVCARAPRPPHRLPRPSRCLQSGNASGSSMTWMPWSCSHRHRWPSIFPRLLLCYACDKKTGKGPANCDSQQTAEAVASQNSEKTDSPTLCKHGSQTTFNFSHGSPTVPQHIGHLRGINPNLSVLTHPK